MIFRWLTFFFMLGSLNARESVVVPQTMQYCDLELQFTPDGRNKLQTQVNQILNSSNYSILLSRAEIWMPYVRQAFRLTGVPMDLSYIIFFESAFIGDAVSPSNAVGFWQFKDFTAKEVGLVVNDQLDERMHIFRASIAAARYFYHVNREFDNWLYATIGYNQGQKGAIPFTEACYYGANAMKITASLHPYALKAIAYKLVYQDLVSEELSGPVWLEPVLVPGGTHLDSILQKYQVSRTYFMQYNLWIHHPILPAGRTYTCFIPHQDGQHPDACPAVEPGLAYVVESWKDTLIERKVYIPPVPLYDPQVYEFRKIETDPGYSVAFFRTGTEQSWYEVADNAGIKMAKLMEINQIGIVEKVTTGRIVLLKPPKKQTVHIAGKGDTWEEIAEIYGVIPYDLMAYNHATNGSMPLPGQKVYLRQYRPLKEKVIVYGENPTTEGGFKTIYEQTQVLVTDTVKLGNHSSYLLPPFETELTHHIVKKGETLWAIGKMYGTRVEILQKLNNLTTEHVPPGTRLTVLVKIPVKE